MSDDRLVADATAKFAEIDRQFAEIQTARENARRELEEAKLTKETREKHRKIIERIDKLIMQLQLSRQELNFGKVEKFVSSISNSNQSFDKLMKVIEKDLLDA